MEKLYKITGKTNKWLAQRSTLFKGKDYNTICSNLTLRQAHEKILDFFNEDYGKAYPNWGLVQCNNPSLSWSCSDGTRGYEYEGRFYSVEEQEGEEEENYGIV